MSGYGVPRLWVFVWELWYHKGSSVCLCLSQSQSAPSIATELLAFLLHLPAEMLVSVNCDSRFPPLVWWLHTCSLETGRRPTQFIQATEHLSGGNDRQSPASLSQTWIGWPRLPSRISFKWIVCSALNLGLPRVLGPCVQLSAFRKIWNPCLFLPLSY